MSQLTAADWENELKALYGSLERIETGLCVESDDSYYRLSQAILVPPEGTRVDVDHEIEVLDAHIDDLGLSIAV